MTFKHRSQVESAGINGSLIQETETSLRARYLSLFWLYLEKNDRAFTPHANQGFWESWITCWIDKELIEHDVFLDVGANVGYYTMLACARGKECISFEPNPEVFNLLYNSCVDNGFKPDLQRIALSDHAHIVNLSSPIEHSGGASIMNEGPTSYPTRNFRVTARALDRVLDLDETKRVLIKVDAEGAEPLIWAGMQHLWYSNPVTMTLEWHAVRWPDGQAEEFAQSLELSSTGLYVIDTEGNEQKVSAEWLCQSKELEMVVVRNA